MVQTSFSQSTEAAPTSAAIVSETTIWKTSAASWKGKNLWQSPEATDLEIEKNAFKERKLEAKDERRLNLCQPAKILRLIAFALCKSWASWRGNVGLTWNNQSKLAFYRRKNPAVDGLAGCVLLAGCLTKNAVVVPFHLCTSSKRYISGNENRGSTYKPMSWMETSLRSLIVPEAQGLVKKLQLRSNIEVDGTSLRVIKVTKNSQRFKTLVKEWIRAHPGTAQPKHWLLHLRVLGCVQRGTPGKLIWAPATPKLVVAGGKSPTQSLHAIESRAQPIA
eukprot:s3744_g1.t1